MTGAAITLAFAMVALDEAVTDRWLVIQSWGRTREVEGAGLMLGTIAGVVFSMALVVLPLTTPSRSSQAPAGTSGGRPDAGLRGGERLASTPKSSFSVQAFGRLLARAPFSRRCGPRLCPAVSIRSA
jgi:hypothetical protein